MVSSYSTDRSRDIVQIDEWKYSVRGGKYARGEFNVECVVQEMIAVGLKY